MDSDTGAKGKSRFDLSDVMTILDGESAKVDEAVDEPQQAEAKAPEVKISIVTLPEISGNQALEAIPEAKPPAIRVPEAIKAPESQNTTAKANNALSTKLLADMEQKNAEILKLKSDFMSLQYKLNEKDYQLKEKDMNIQVMSTKLSDTQKKLETQQRQNNDLQSQQDDLQRKLESLQRLHDDLQRQLEGQQRQNVDLQKQLESQQRLHDDLRGQYDTVKAELDTINEDKARVIARAESHKLKKSEGSTGEEAPAAPSEEDVASIFKRLTQDTPEETTPNAQQQGSVPGMDRPQPPRKLKTAKLYDL